jgi:hypothetical protein
MVEPQVFCEVLGFEGFTVSVEIADENNQVRPEGAVVR